MAVDTKAAIARLANNYMSNPNAIILCIQGLSFDEKKGLFGHRCSFIQTEVLMPSEAM